MIRSFLNYIFLPREISGFEEQYVKRLNSIVLIFFIAHIPVMALVAFLCGQSPLQASLAAAACLFGPVIAYRSLDNPRHIAMVYGFTSMCMGGLLCHFGQGPMQIEMHFYFFVSLALLAVFGNPMVVITAAITAAIHHLLVYIFFPRSVFNYDASVWVVLVHALFVVLESVASVFIARSFFDNVIGLEKIVKARTNELDARNRETRLVLDNVAQALFTLSLDGVISRERSLVTDAWFGTIADNSTFAEVLRRIDPNFEQMFEVGFAQVVDPDFPTEVALSLLPSALVANGRNLKLNYEGIFASEAGGESKLERVLVVVTDVTSEIERQRAEAEQQELMSVFERAMRDKLGFLEFVAEADQLVSRVAERESLSLPELKRIIHTLKGNASIYGLVVLADHCHTVENGMSETGSHPTSASVASICDRWNNLRQQLRRLLDGEESKIELDDEEYQEILQAVLEGRDRNEIAAMIHRWRYEPTRKRFQAMGERASALAQRLGKGGLKVEVQDNHVRLPREELGGFWSSLVHVVRNAIDHGIEPPEVREAGGKEPNGKLVFRSRNQSETVVIEIEDDGIGVNWEKLLAKAKERGVEVRGQEDLIDVMFADGVSTKDEVSMVSGRGVGLAAVRDAIDELNGEVEVESRPGGGTSFKFKIPVAVAKDIV